MATQLTVYGRTVRWTEQIGRGATSAVWLGDADGTPCVLKLGKGPGEAPRFADEAERLLTALNTRAPRTLYTIYLTRIALYRATPPDPGWDGVFVYTTK